jgi:alpha-D-xyloside xylohydrolase
LKLLTYAQGQDGLVLETTQGRLRLQAISENVIRATYTLGTDFSATPSLLVPPRARPGEARGGLAVLPDGRLEFRAAKLSVRIDPATLAFSWHDRAGKLLTSEPDRGGKTLDPFTLTKYRFENDAALSIQSGADGQKVRANEGTPYADRISYHTKLEFA